MQHPPPLHQPKPKFSRTPSLTINLERDTRDSFFWQHRKSFVNQGPRRESNIGIENDSCGSFSLSKNFCCLTPIGTQDQSPSNTRTNFNKLKRMLNSGSLTKNKSFVDILRKSLDSSDEENEVERSREKTQTKKKRGVSMILDKVFNQAKIVIKEIERQKEDELQKVKSYRNKENQYCFNQREPKKITPIDNKWNQNLYSRQHSIPAKAFPQQANCSSYKSVSYKSVNSNYKKNLNSNTMEGSSLRMRCAHGHKLHTCPSCSIAKTLNQNKLKYR